MGLKSIDEKILSLANNLTEEKLKEAQKSFSLQIEQFRTKQYGKGMWNSSITGNKLLELIENEFKKRTLIILEVYIDCFKAGQIILNENIGSELKQYISNLLHKTSSDLISVYQEASKLLLSMRVIRKSIDEIRNYALRSSFNKIDFLVLEVCSIPNNLPITKSSLPKTQLTKMQLLHKEVKLKLIRRLSSLPNPAFNNLLTVLGVERSLISERNPQATQVSELLDWAESEMGSGLATVEEALNELLNPIVDPRDV